MSHYTRIEIEFSDQECLIKALESLGFTGKLEVHEWAQSLIGYQGDTRQQKANIIIRRKYVGGAANDIGFEKQADGKFVAHISEYDSHKYNKQWLGKLKQAYTVERVTKETKKRGFQITNKTTKDGKVYMTVQTR